MTNEQKLRECLLMIRPALQELAHTHRDEGQNNVAMYALMMVEEVLVDTDVGVVVSNPVKEAP